MVFCFADIEIDTQRYELHRGGKLVSIEPLIFDLIVYLIRNTDKLFSRDDLITAVWQGRVVSDATVSSAIKSARKALGDDGNTQKYIKTVHGRGFKFIGKISTAEPPEKSNRSVLRENRIQTRHPSVIVLAPRILSQEPSTEQLSKGLQANLETILTRVPLLNISAYSEQFSSRQSAATPRQIYEQLGIDYVIDGMVQVVQDQFRVNVNLTQAKSGFRLWSEQFEHRVIDQGSVLDTLVMRILGKLEPQLNRAIYHDVHTDQDDPGSRQYYLQASTLLATRGWHRDNFLEAAGLLEQSRKFDPGFALAPAYLSLILALGHRVGLLSRTNETRLNAIAAAETAMELDNMDSTVLGFSGCALADIGELNRAFDILNNAIELNPSNAQAWTALGSAYLLKHDPGPAIEHLTHGIKISPLDTRLSIWQAVLALAYMQAHDIDKAKENAEMACQRDDKTYLPRVVLAAAHVTQRKLEPATSALLEARRIKPDLSKQEIQGVVGKTLAQALIQLSI